MNTYTTVIVEAINAGHALEGHPHGHQYTVRVHVAGDQLPSFHGATLTDSTADDIRRIIHELDRRDLGLMIPAGYASVNGIAAYLLERLTILGAHKVEVDESDGYTAIAERDIPR